MLRIQLDCGHYALYDVEHDGPLTVALHNNCFESLFIINNGDYNFDYQYQNNKGLSFIGQIIKQLQDMAEESGDQFDKLCKFADTIFGNITLDMHKEQFANTGTIEKKISAWQLIFKNLRHHRKIKYATQSLINIAKAQGNYELNEVEQQTLFKSAMKLLMAHGNDAVKAWKQLGEFCTLCNVNVFESKDKRGKGLEHRLARQWPTQIDSSHQFKGIIEAIETKQMKEDGTNSQSIIFGKFASPELLGLIFGGSIHSSEMILKIDGQNKMDIKDLDKDAATRKLAIKHLAYALLSNTRTYESLEPQIRKRMANQAVGEELK